jgi:hypothetical protein
MGLARQYQALQPSQMRLGQWFYQLGVKWGMVCGCFGFGFTTSQFVLISSQAV